MGIFFQMGEHSGPFFAAGAAGLLFFLYSLDSVPELEPISVNSEQKKRCAIKVLEGDGKWKMSFFRCRSAPITSSQDGSTGLSSWVNNSRERYPAVDTKLCFKPEVDDISYILKTESHCCCGHNRLYEKERSSGGGRGEEHTHTHTRTRHCVRVFLWCLKKWQWGCLF